MKLADDLLDCFTLCRFILPGKPHAICDPNKIHVRPRQKRLSRYSAVAVLTARVIGDSGLSALERYVRTGGKLFVEGDAGSVNERGNPRPRPSFFGKNIGKGECTYFGQLPPVDKLAEILKIAEGDRVPRLEASAGVVYNVVEQPRDRRLIVHLLNYGASPAENFKIVLQKNYTNAILLSPDMPNSLRLSQHPAVSGHEVIIPKLNIYAVLDLEK